MCFPLGVLGDFAEQLFCRRPRSCFVIKPTVIEMEREVKDVIVLGENRVHTWNK